MIFCDRQGGRSHYGQLLRLMFEDWALEIVSETESRAEYRLMQKNAAVRIIFCEKAEAQCLPVAVASMLSKYLREALMHRFNAFWKGHLPTVEPTAGYYSTACASSPTSRTSGWNWGSATISSSGRDERPGFRVQGR